MKGELCVDPCRVRSHRVLGAAREASSYVTGLPSRPSSPVGGSTDSSAADPVTAGMMPTMAAGPGGRPQSLAEVLAWRRLAWRRAAPARRRTASGGGPSWSLKRATASRPPRWAPGRRSHTPAPARSPRRHRRRPVLLRNAPQPPAERRPPCSLHSTDRSARPWPGTATDTRSYALLRYLEAADLLLEQFGQPQRGAVLEHRTDELYSHRQALGGAACGYGGGG